MKAGFIGLGNMGQGMAGSLLKAGHTVTVYNRTPGRAPELVRAGAIEAGSVADVAVADAVITMLADDAAVEAVAEVLVGVLGSGTVHVSMSTISVKCCDRLQALHAAAGKHFISAPVWGRPEVAAAGQLMIVPAGDSASIERCRPLFDAMGQRTLVLGPVPSAANLAKLSGNFMIAGIIEGLAEAFALARKSGIAADAYLELLQATLFNLPVQSTYADIIAGQKFDPAGFRARLGLKDISLVLEAAGTLAVPMPLASLLRDQFLSAVAQGATDQDWTIIARLAAERAGLPS